MNLIKNYTILLCLLVLYSCGERYKSFYEENQEPLQELVNKIAKVNFVESACCVEDGCFEDVVEVLMNSLQFECVRRDTIERTLNFTGSSSSKLKTVEFVYQYSNNGEEPKSYPKAGEEIKRISKKWFVRKIYFD